MYTAKTRSNSNTNKKNKTSSPVAAQRKTDAAMGHLKSGQPNSLQSNMYEEVTKTSDVGSTVTQEKPNQTGLPDQLKNGIENLSGYSMDDVRVHYNSSKPAKLQSLAYTQGNEIHVAPGQEKHLEHEAWHVIQQKQGRVASNTQMEGTNINNDRFLEREADVMGAKAIQMKNQTYDNLITKKYIKNDVAQCFTKNKKQYTNLSSYYNILGKKNKRKNELAVLKELFPDILENTDITDCNNWNQIKTQIYNQFNKKLPEYTKILFDKFNKNMYKDMDFSNKNDGLNVFLDERYYKTIKELYGNKLGLNGDKKGIFHALAHHYNLNRPDTPANISPDDITKKFDNSKSCIITALFNAEREKIKQTFGANNVEELHNFLVECFSENKYSNIKEIEAADDQKEVTDDQKNNVWKNYSDDSVYPSMYDYFGYAPSNILQGSSLSKDIKNDLMLLGKGIIIISGHAIYFQKEKGEGADANNQYIKLYDNEHSGAVDISNWNRSQNRVTQIERIYCPKN